MSHFTKVQTSLSCLSTIEKVLEELKYKIRRDRASVRGYGQRTMNADVVVDTGLGLDIGFILGDEGYEVVADWEYLERRNLERSDFMSRLKQRYSYHKVLERVQKSGFTVVEEGSDKAGAVTLRVRRWN